MRHRHSGRQLNRNSSHRKAMFRNMAVSLVEHELIKTTVPKAKELRGYAEPLITLAKTDSVANRRLAFDRTRSKEAVGKLFDELGPRYAERPGGYIRILKCGFRTGDKCKVMMYGAGLVPASGWIVITDGSTSLCFLFWSSLRILATRKFWGALSLKRLETLLKILALSSQQPLVVVHMHN